ncbi:unnamed protein product, partial [Hymenolepis diminuta]
NETSIELENIIKIRGLRIIIKDAIQQHEYINIKMGFYGTIEPQCRGDFDPCDPKIDENADSLCEASVVPRGYIPGQDY